MDKQKRAKRRRVTLYLEPGSAEDVALDALVKREACSVPDAVRLALVVAANAC